MKWEYKTYPDVADRYVALGYVSLRRIGKDATLTMARLKKYGKQGWELTTVYDGIAYFKRPAKEVTEEVVER